MGLATADERRFSEIAARYVDALGPRLAGVAAFGSRARGDARAESDFDVFVVADGLPRDPFARAGLVRGALSGLRALDVQVVAHATDEFLASVTSLYLDLALDAVVLYDRDGFLATSLARLRRRIEEAGLVRTPSLFWRFTRPHRADWAIEWDEVRV